ncbi:DnaJ-domain-containing protein [Piromyces finnis]|uniref:DnaJ-domain-containing protein n=1 Tax=Piromyces finnis TaxID=1754191 RepID=A0A1Y1V9A3_9FUNG|nr:DnaJ-domain-containing protein [Piromyces finnis]|eukprot:ORX50280.1 DnaJ-domain-containing protein [Piromyces finnis]
MTTKKYYEILGLSETATDAEIKKAYRKEALRWHPDKNQDRLEEANEHFKLISEAYEVLKDPEQRAIYNKYGDEGFKDRANGGGADYGNGGFHSFHFSNPEDIFREFFGGQDPFASFFSPFGGSSRRGSNSRRNDPFGGGFFGSSFFDDDDDFFGGHGSSGFSSFSSTSFGGPSFSSFSSSSFGGGMGGGNFVSTSQRTTVVNGKKTIIKETKDGSGNTTVEKTTIEPDGRRTTETIVNGKQQSLITDNNQGSSNNRLKIEDQYSSGSRSQRGSNSRSSYGSSKNSGRGFGIHNFF